MAVSSCGLFNDKRASETSQEKNVDLATGIAIMRDPKSYFVMDE